MDTVEITFTRMELGDLCEALWEGKKRWAEGTVMRVKLDDQYEDLYEQYQLLKTSQIAYKRD